MSPSFFYLIRTSSHPQAPLRSVHAVTEVASSRRIAHPLVLSSSHPQAPLHSTHAFIEIASYRRIAHPLVLSSASTTAFGACGYRDSVLQTHGTHVSFSHPQAPLRSVHAVTEIASYRRIDTLCHVHRGRFQTCQI